MISGISGTSSCYIGTMNTQSMQQRRDHMFSKIDSSGDGGIDKTEFSAFAQKLSEKTGNTTDVDDVYSTYDTDGDGVLSKDELDKFVKDNAPPPPSEGQDDPLSKIDSSGDGGIDKTEFSDFAQKLSERTGNSIDVDDVYSNYDADGDGVLSKDEMKSFMKDNAPRPPADRYSDMSAYSGDSSSLINVTV